MSVKITNCLNCGAPLSGSVCQYCGTSYGDESAPMSVVIDNDSLREAVRLHLKGVLLRQAYYHRRGRRDMSDALLITIVICATLLGLGITLCAAVIRLYEIGIKEREEDQDDG